MRRLRFPIAVAVTSLVLVAAALAIGALVVPGALASGPWMGPWRAGAHAFGGPGFDLPPELQGLASVPPSERFAHFVGAQVSLKDKDGHPLAIEVTPGAVTAASATSLTVAANDGTTRTFALDSATRIHGKSTASGTPTAAGTIHNGDQVVVVTLSSRPTAVAVLAGQPGGAGWFGSPGPWGTGPAER